LLGILLVDLRRIFVSLLANSRNADARVNEKAAIEDATMLFNAGWNKLFNDSAEFHAMLFTQSTAQLSRIFVEFQKLSGMSIEEFQKLAAMETELVPGNALDGYLAVLTAMQYRTRFFANQLHNAVKGLGTRDGDLIRIVVSRSEIDLQEISEAYEKEHTKSLREAIEGDTSGAHRECLLAIVNGN